MAWGVFGSPQLPLIYFGYGPFIHLPCYNAIHPSLPFPVWSVAGPASLPLNPFANFHLVLEQDINIKVELPGLFREQTLRPLLELLNTCP